VLPIVGLRLAAEVTLSVVLESGRCRSVEVEPLKNCTLPEASPSLRLEAPIVIKWTGPPARGWAAATLAATTHWPGNSPVHAPEIEVTEGALPTSNTTGEEDAVA
jgi:hypothetical protein